MIIRNVIFSNRCLAERYLVVRHFSEKALNRMPFHRSHSAVLYCLCYIIIAIYYRSSSIFITGQMTECFLLLHCAATRKSSVLSPPKHSVTFFVSAPDQDEDRLWYNSSFVNSKSFSMKGYFDATTVSLNIQVKFLNFSCFTSCGCLTYSACITYSLLHQSWGLSYDVKLIMITDRIRSFEMIDAVCLTQ